MLWQVLVHATEPGVRILRARARAQCGMFSEAKGDAITAGKLGADEDEVRRTLNDIRKAKMQRQESDRRLYVSLMSSMTKSEAVRR